MAKLALNTIEPADFEEEEDAVARKELETLEQAVLSMVFQTGPVEMPKDLCKMDGITSPRLVTATRRMIREIIQRGYFKELNLREFLGYDGHDDHDCLAAVREAFGKDVKNGWNWNPELLEFIVIFSPLSWKFKVTLMDCYFIVDFGPFNFQIGLPLWYERNT